MKRFFLNGIESEGGQETIIRQNELAPLVAPDLAETRTSFGESTGVGAELADHVAAFF
jgi:hypothetical protein